MVEKSGVNNSIWLMRRTVVLVDVNKVFPIYFLIYNVARMADENYS